jgi:hypothetical protein
VSITRGNERTSTKCGCSNVVVVPCPCLACLRLPPGRPRTSDQREGNFVAPVLFKNPAQVIIVQPRCERTHSNFCFYLGLDLDRQTPMLDTRTSDKVQILEWPCVRMDREPLFGISILKPTFHRRSDDTTHRQEVGATPIFRSCLRT